jgi:putative transposase
MARTPPSFPRRLCKTLEAVPEEIGGIEDHVHLLLGLRATHCLADVLREIKKVSSRWVHEKVRKPKFAWQEGYGAFTVSCSNVPAVRGYIAAQAQHHRKRTFQDEYLDLLTRHEVAFDERFLW